MFAFLRRDRLHRATRFIVAATLLLAFWSVRELQLSWTKSGSMSIYSILLASQGVNGNEAKGRACEEFEDVQTLRVKDECLLRYIREQLLTPPSTLNYSQKALGHPPGSSREVKNIFRNKTNGFFIECGANDGVFHSNTLALERDQNWTGLLVEAHPKFQKPLLDLHRKAWFANVCLSPFNNVSKIKFIERDKFEKKWQDAMGKLVMNDDPSPRKTKSWGFQDYGSVPCFPLVSILAAMNVTHVDFLSLDVEGVELKILKTLPFDESLTIDVLIVENNNLPEGKEALKSFMQSKGYELVLTKPIDYIFKRIST